MDKYIDTDLYSSDSILWQTLETDLPNLKKQDVLDFIFSHTVVYDVPLEDFNPDGGYSTKFPIFTRNALTFFHRNGFNKEFQTVLSEQRNLEKSYHLVEKMLKGENIEEELVSPSNELLHMARNFAQPLTADLPSFHGRVYPPETDYPHPSVEELGGFLRIYRYLDKTSQQLEEELKSTHCWFNLLEEMDKLRQSIRDHLNGNVR